MEYDIHLSDATIKKLMADTGDSGGGESGGGGDSDYSIAKVTINFVNYYESAPCFWLTQSAPFGPIPGGGSDYNLIIAAPYSTVNGQIFDIPLYKGVCVLSHSIFTLGGDISGITTSGDIIEMPGNFLITGDGEITITYSGDNVDD